MNIGGIYLPGTCLNNRYEVVKQLGRGATSKVYLVRDLQMDGALLALKQMTVDFIDYDQYIKAMEDFNREADILSKLEHPSIPSLHDYFLVDGDFVLVMQYVEGQNLEQHLNQSPMRWLEEKQVTEWSIQLCDTLNYLHLLDPPIIYRDLKPPNIIFNDKLQQIFLIDFGIARFIKPSVNFVTAIGTFGYAPPELCLGKVEPASDIYSLGATMYNLLTGIIPEVFDAAFNFSLRILPRKINNNISVEMESILIKALAGKPENRFPSAQAMKIELENHLNNIINENTTTDYVESTLKYPPKEWGYRSENQPITANGRVKIYHKKKKITELCVTSANYSIGRRDARKGTTPDMDLSIIDKSGKISRQHGRILRLTNNYYFEDTGSTYGSSLNGERLTPYERKLLRSGDRISLGEVIIEFIIEKGTDYIGG